MAESPSAAWPPFTRAAAIQNVLAVEYHSIDIPWWNDLAVGIDNPLSKTALPGCRRSGGLGIESLNEEPIAQHLSKDYPGQWESTSQWDNEWANDRTWS